MAYTNKNTRIQIKQNLIPKSIINKKKEIISDYTSPTERGFLNSGCFPLILAKRLIALLLRQELKKQISLFCQCIVQLKR